MSTNGLLSIFDEGSGKLNTVIIHHTESNMSHELNSFMG